MIRIGLGAYKKYVGEKVEETLGKNWREGMTEKQHSVDTETTRLLEELSNTSTTTRRRVDCWQMLGLDVCRPEYTGPDIRTSKRPARNVVKKRKL